MRNLKIEIDIDKILSKLGISLKTKRYILLFIILVITMWLVIPPMLGYYYFEPSTCLDGGKGTIILEGEKSLVCSVGGFCSKYTTKTGALVEAAYSDSYVSELTFKNEILTFFADGNITSKFEVKNRFFWILWRQLEPSLKNGVYDEDYQWHYELPLYNPIAFYQTFSVWKRYLKEKDIKQKDIVTPRPVQK